MQIETLDSTLNCGAGAEGKAGETRRPIGKQAQHKAPAVSFPRVTRVMPFVPSQRPWAATGLPAWSYTSRTALMSVSGSSN